MVAAFLPWKRLDPTAICPPGVVDPTDVNNLQASRVANYSLWLQNMKNFRHMDKVKVIIKPPQNGKNGDIKISGGPLHLTSEVIISKKRYIYVQ